MSIVLHDIANNNRPYLLPDMDPMKSTTYKDFILHTAESIHTFTAHQLQRVYDFLCTYEHCFRDTYRIIKYDEKHRAYYHIMVAIYGVSCPYFNPDYSIDISASILIDMMSMMRNGCACSKTNPLHRRLMHL